MPVAGLLRAAHGTHYRQCISFQTVDILPFNTNPKTDQKEFFL